MKITINQVRNEKKITFNDIPFGGIFFYVNQLYLKLPEAGACNPIFPHVKYNAIELNTGRWVCFGLPAETGTFRFVTSLTAEVSDKDNV